MRTNITHNRNRVDSEWNWFVWSRSVFGLCCVRWPCASNNAQLKYIQQATANARRNYEVPLPHAPTVRRRCHDFGSRHRRLNGIAYSKRRLRDRNNVPCDSLQFKACDWTQVRDSMWPLHGIRRIVEIETSMESLGKLILRAELHWVSNTKFDQIWQHSRSFNLSSLDAIFMRTFRADSWRSNSVNRNSKKYFGLFFRKLFFCKLKHSNLEKSTNSTLGMIRKNEPLRVCYGNQYIRPVTGTVFTA